MSALGPEAEHEIVMTTHGVAAIRDRATGELMHPVVGPIVEAERLYIGPSCLEARLGEASPEPLVLLDVGLGAGSNAIAAWKVSERSPGAKRPLAIVSFERTLSAMALALGEGAATGDEEPSAVRFGFDGDALGAASELLARGASDASRTSWRLVRGELPETLATQREASADVVFWDPFSPRANPSLWTLAAFTAVRRLCRPGATLHTYSAATSTRTALLLAGFAVGVGAVTSGNKPTTVAACEVESLAEPLGARWLQRLERSSAPFPSDAPSDALARIASLPQFAKSL